jgi:hypothetical protein
LRPVQSWLTDRSRANAAALAAAVQPPPGPPLPISENVRTDAAVSSPERDEVPQGASRAAPPDPSAVATSRVSSAGRWPTPKLPELPEPTSFRTTSPFSPSTPAPIGVDQDRPPWAAPPAKTPARRVRARSALRRDYRI